MTPEQVRRRESADRGRIPRFWHYSTIPVTWFIISDFGPARNDDIIGMKAGHNYLERIW